LINQWINAGKRAVVGDPDLSAYDLAIKGTMNEYAKIVSGSMGNTAVAEGEIKKANDLLNAAQTPEQVNAVLDMMRRETQNRMAGFDDQIGELKNSMRSPRPQPGAASVSAKPSSRIAKSDRGYSVSTPDGQSFTFPSEGAAFEFLSRAGLR
jgi:hypothetical protein